VLGTLNRPNRDQVSVDNFGPVPQCRRLLRLIPDSERKPNYRPSILTEANNPVAPDTENSFDRSRAVQSFKLSTVEAQPPDASGLVTRAIAEQEDFTV
jgi:hypothetical protein